MTYKLKSIFTLLIFLTSVFILYGQQSLELKVGSYNIRYDNQGDRDKGDGWEHRLPVISSIIHWEDVDVFGAQEVLAHQLEGMLEELPAYDAYGIGRDDGKKKGEYAPVFFKKEKFTLLDSGSFWLSETPETPSKGWDASLPRICSWVHLKEKTTGETFWYFNLHLDHRGIKAREESCLLVLEKMKEIVGEGTAFLTGDFNVDQHTDMYDVLHDSQWIYDAYETADKRMAWNGTFNAFDDQLWTESRIDHIFTTENVQVSHYAVLTETYRSDEGEKEDVRKGDFPEEYSFKKYKSRLPSDHFPIFARVSLQLN